MKIEIEKVDLFELIIKIASRGHSAIKSGNEWGYYSKQLLEYSTALAKEIKTPYPSEFEDPNPKVGGTD